MIRAIYGAVFSLLIGCGAEIDYYYDSGETDMQPLGWSQSGKLQIANSRKGVGLQAKFPVIGNYTVQFNIEALGNMPFGTARTAARAEIQWAVRGNIVKRLITVSDGTAITGTAESVSVRLFDNSDPTLFPGDTRQYNGSIQIAKGTRGSNKQPPYLVLGSVPVAPGGQGVIPIPTDIGANSVFIAASPNTPNNTIPPGLLRVSQEGTLFTSWDPREYDWVPLDPGAVDLLFEVGAAAPVGAVFTAFLGIDG